VLAAQLHRLRKRTKWLKPTKSGWKPLPESQEQNWHEQDIH
jgi:hypothetical protein